MLNCTPVNHFCTITTASHMYKTYALAESLSATGNNMLHVLVIDGGKDYSFTDCKFYDLHDIRESQIGQQIIGKYKNEKDKLRWSLKPVFMKHLMQQGASDKIIYLDNDLFFYFDSNFLFELLDKHSFLLTPHYYKNNPKRDQNWFEANFRVGLYNAGFVGASDKAIDTLQWWADCCAYRCEKSAIRGLFDDQKYLDLVPVLEETAHIVRHKGCNVAGWNTEVCKREIVEGQVLIDGKYPVVFIHFNDTAIREIVEGDDTILMNYYRNYVRTLKKYKLNLSEKELVKPQRLSDKMKFIVWKVITELGI